MPGAGAVPGPARTAPGATKTTVLEALSGGGAMTSCEIAAATGLGRATVSTTLSKLPKSAELTKTARGYQLAGSTAPAAPIADAGAESEPPSA